MLKFLVKSLRPSSSSSSIGKFHQLPSADGSTDDDDDEDDGISGFSSSSSSLSLISTLLPRYCYATTITVAIIITAGHQKQSHPVLVKISHAQRPNPSWIHSQRQIEIAADWRSLTSVLILKLEGSADDDDDDDDDDE
jgi:hypothetical protein